MLPPARAELAATLLSVFTIFAILHNAASRSSSAAAQLSPRATRSSLLDLEIGGELIGVPPKTTHYVSRNDLLALPQVTGNVSDDANFTAPTQIAGVSLADLTKALASSPTTAMVVAMCDDRYRANYPRDYIAAHNPVLVLTISGQPPDRWPKDPETHTLDMGPYLISHPKFTPRYKVLSQPEEPQIPWGVVRLEFRDEKTVFGAIAPRGPRAQNPSVQDGYRIARQNCFRCHNMGDEGGQKANRPWSILATWAAASSDYFAAYIRNPKSKNPKAEMPGFPAYDDATIAALRDYFQTFGDRARP